MPTVVGFVAGWAGMALTGATSAAFIGAYGAGLAFGGTLFGSLTFKLLTTVALTALQVAVAGPSGSGGITISSTQAGEDNPETILLGWTATAGSLVCPPYSHGKNNRYLTHVVELCSAPGATVERLILGDDYVDLGPTPHADYGAPVISGPFAGFAWVKYYDGSQTAADAMLLDRYGAHPDRPWSADMIGAGICYAILTFQYDKEKMNSPPRYRFEMMGIPVYDLRADSTAGGSGPQRWADPATWEQSTNPAVLVWNIKRGIALPGGAVWGGQVAEADLPQAAWTAAMNAADAPISLSGGGTEPAYRAGIEAPLTTEPANIEAELLKACSGQVASSGGSWTIRVGAPSLPVYSFTDDDVLVSRPEELTPFPELSSTYNAVAARHPDPDAGWEPREAPLRTNAEWEAEDLFGRKVADLALPAVPYRGQVSRLMRAWIEDERRFARHAVWLPPDALPLDPLDTVSWSSAHNGYEAKTFEVAEIVEDLRTCIVQLVLREVDPDDYDWEPGFALPDAPATIGTTLPIDATVDGFDADGVLLTGGGAGERAGIALTWDDDLIADGLRWQIRPAGGGGKVLSGTTQALEEGGIIVSGGILPAGDYEARARLITDGLGSTWTGWVSLTTPSALIGISELDAYVAGGIADGISAAVIASTALSAAGAAQDDADAATAAHNDFVAGTEGSISALFAEYDAHVSGAFSTMSASLAGDIAQAGMLLRAAMEAPDGSIGSLEATLTTYYSTTVDMNTAISGAVSTYDASVGGGIAANVTASVSAIADLEGWATATYLLTASTSGGQIASFELIAYDGAGGATSGSAIKLNADLVTATGTITAPLMAAGSITAANAALGNASVETLNIKGKAVTVPVDRYWVFNPAKPITNTTWKKIGKATIKKPAGLNYGVLVSGVVSFAGYGNGIIDISIWRGSTIIAGGINMPTTQGIRTSLAYEIFDTNTASGDQEYSIQARKVDPKHTGGWNADLVVNRLSMTLRETMR